MDFEGARERVRSLVATRFGKNQNLAAREWGVSQPTLNRFLAGKTDVPRADFLAKIARYHGMTVDGLISGEEPGMVLPTGPRRVVEHWRRLVESLDLSKPCARALLLLPRTTERAFRDLALMGLRAPMPRGESVLRTEVHSRMSAAAWQAGHHEHDAWITLLSGMIEAYGKVNVRKKLEGEWPILALGFQGLAVYLLTARKIQTSSLDAEFAEYAPEGSTLDITPAPMHLPPLEQLRAIDGSSRGTGR